MTTLSSEAHGLPQAGDLIGGKFRITETLGQGGMGVVLGGEHLDLRQAVAIKLLRPSLAKEPDALARFLREARSAASIKSRHAVRIYDVGTTDTGIPYMVMERLHGVGVDALLERDGPLPVEQAVQITVEAGEAIAEANRLGIVHRDVKPSNLYLANDASGAPIVKVLDFGISKRLTVDQGEESASLTAPQTLLGSPQYMSPEQLRDPRSVDERTDVWGLGVTLYELLTGRMPFECDSIAELCALIFNSTPERADSIRPQIPSGLSDIIDECLAKQAERRIPTVAALVARLAPFGRGDLATSAEKLARVATERADSVRTRGAPLAPPSRRRLFLAGALALSAVIVSVGAYLLSARGEGRYASEGSTQASAAPKALSAEVVPQPSVALTPGTASASNSAGSTAEAPAAASGRPASSTSARPAPAAAPRATGLKGIKLID